MTELLSWTPDISYVMSPNTPLVMVTIIEPLNCYVILPRTLSLMVKLSLGSQGMLPIPVPAKVVVAVSGKHCKETGNLSFHLLLTHLHKTRDTGEKTDELACFLLCFPKEQKICELRCLLDPMISPFRTEQQETTSLMEQTTHLMLVTRSKARPKLKKQLN